MKENSIDILRIIEEAITKNESHNIGLKGGKAFSEFTYEDFTHIFNYCNLYGNKINAVNFISYCMRDFWNDFHKCNFQENIWKKDVENFNFLEVIIHIWRVVYLAKFGRYQLSKIFLAQV